MVHSRCSTATLMMPAASLSNFLNMSFMFLVLRDLLAGAQS